MRTTISICLLFLYLLNNNSLLKSIFKEDPNIDSIHLEFFNDSIFALKIFQHNYPLFKQKNYDLKFEGDLILLQEKYPDLNKLITISKHSSEYFGYFKKKTIRFLFVKKKLEFMI